MPSFTTLLAQRQTKTFVPFHDPHRIYTEEHELTVYGCGVTPLTRISVSLYDLPQRRWYELNVERPMSLTDENEQWFLDTVDKCITECQEPFNTINIDEVGNVTYSIKPNIGRPLRRPIVSSSLLPLVRYSDIIRKKYLWLSADICIWNGRDCVFKNLEFDNYIGFTDKNIPPCPVSKEVNIGDVVLVGRRVLFPISRR